jgi:hypothetical protein
VNGQRGVYLGERFRVEDMIFKTYLFAGEWYENLVGEVKASCCEEYDVSRC